MGEISRRTLMRGGVVLAATVPLSGWLLTTDVAFASVLARSSFTPYLGQRFSLAGASMVLAAIEDLPNARPGDPKRFSLVFRTVGGTQPEQGTWTLTHPKMGKVTLFLVPVGRRADLQAVFNAV
jgi:hypothetical protein